ncbi:MAG: HNH endonuclease, partial [Actinomycetota bacterium]|nr:HNH endonuclease [Actinomycetota bacterium]
MAHEVLEELASVVDRLSGIDPSELADGESVVALHRCLARTEAITTRASAAFDAGGAWQAEGARSPSAWLSRRCDLPSSTARRRIRLGRALRHLPAAEEAWLAGELGEAQMAALSRARTPATEEAMARDEEMLVGEAIRLRFDSFVRALSYWSQWADPDGTEDDAASGRDARRLHLSQSYQGMWFGDLVLDPISGAIVDNQLTRIVDELFEADWAEARSRLGERATTSDLARTPAQRRADALVEMARRAGAMPEGARRPEPLFSVLVGYETLAGRICELANGSVVSPGSLVGHLDEAWVERVVFEAPSRVMDVGVTRRLFDGATRRAIQVRDRECFHDLCDERAERCQIDHVEPYSAGGATIAANGRPACGHHNRARHRRT